MRMAKLTEADRTEIVRRLHAGEKQQVLADEFNVSQSTINRVKSRALKAEQERIKAEQERIDDPFPELATETLQEQYWLKYARLAEIVVQRQLLLDMKLNPRPIIEEVGNNERRAQRSPSSELAEVYRNRANTYRQELVAFRDLPAYDAEMTELLSELNTLAVVLVKVRDAGMGEKGVHLKVS